jgi:hypothetical protein
MTKFVSSRILDKTSLELQETEDSGGKYTQDSHLEELGPKMELNLKWALMGWLSLIHRPEVYTYLPWRSCHAQRNAQRKEM